MPLLSLRRDERGFTMVTVIITMLVVMLLSVAALSAAQNDLPAGKHDTDRKIAYAAAEAGVQNYLYHLTEDPDYWSKCTAVAAPVNHTWDGTSPRTWAPVPGGQSRYTVELLPANGTAACLPASPDATMIDTATGTIRIRVTGQALNPDGVGGVKRTIVVNLRRDSLLDYVWFTDKESQDGSLLAIYTAGWPTDRLTGAATEDVTQWGPAACDRYYGSDAGVGSREDQVFSGSRSSSTGIYRSSQWYNFSLGCREISFAATDAVKGPLHTNDEIHCQAGSPAAKFGRAPGERIEVASLGQTAAAPAGYHGCTPYVNFGTSTSKTDAGTWKGKGDGTGQVSLPDSNGEVYGDTAAAYRFVGRTVIQMNGTQMTIVTGRRETGPPLINETVDLPADGALFVSNAATPACPPYNPNATTATSAGCGNLEIRGTYSVNVTFAAESDIIVTEDITRVSGSDALLGLIAERFVRVHHPIGGISYNPTITGSGSTITAVNPSCSNNSSPDNIRIDGSILAVDHSFMVDNYFCGSSLGTLTVNGAIVQNYRGTVGTAAGTGYPTKSYAYDNRLKYRSPPKFLDPVAAAWNVQTFNEQIPAR